MPSLTEALEHLRNPVRRCPVGHWVASLPDDQQQAVEEIIAVSKSGHAAHRVLSTIDEFQGQKIPPRSTLGYHRRGECMCRR